LKCRGAESDLINFQQKEESAQNWLLHLYSMHNTQLNATLFDVFECEVSQ